MIKLSDFEDIRPYRDDEVSVALHRLLSDDAFYQMMLNYNLPSWAGCFAGIIKPFLRWWLSHKTRNVSNIKSFQHDIFKPYVERMIKQTSAGFSYSGVDKLVADEAYLFISNHRDITLDPAFVDFALASAHLPTVRIGIGDNLIQKQFVTELMKINQSFIVKRDIGSPRQLLLEMKKLSAFIKHSLLDEKVGVWLAQREGRAKDGNDKTDSAVIKMLALAYRNSNTLENARAAIKLIPVSIAYEYDPCDLMKVNELYQLNQQGSYAKQQGEDMQSIVGGITGFKGRIHLHFGDVIKSADGLNKADEIARMIDEQIINNYHLFPSNCTAWQLLNQQHDSFEANKQKLLACPEVDEHSFVDEEFLRRYSSLAKDQRGYLLNLYGNCVNNKLALVN